MILFDINNLKKGLTHFKYTKNLLQGTQYQENEASSPYEQNYISKN